MKHTKLKRYTKRAASQKRYEDAQRLRLLERCHGLCEECGKPPDWRGLSLSHTKLKGMGGTIHVYKDDEVQLLCGKCHSKSHGIKELDNT